MLTNLNTHKLLWRLVLILTLSVSLVGIFKPGIYLGVYAGEFLPSAFPQDILTAILSTYLLFLIATMKEKDFGKQIFVIGVIGSFFYLYGIFTMERVYNFLYIFYLAIFALSFWSIIYSLTTIKKDFVKRVSISDLPKKLSSYFAIFIGVLFSILWTRALIPLMKTHNRIDLGLG